MCHPQGERERNLALGFALFCFYFVNGELIVNKNRTVCSAIFSLYIYIKVVGFFFFNAVNDCKFVCTLWLQVFFVAKIKSLAYTHNVMKQ